MANETNILLRNLPEIYHESEDLRMLLNVFDEVLFGTESHHSEKLGLEQIIANIPNLLNPKPGQATSGAFDRTPGDFLPWLAGWVALEPLHVMSEEQFRHVIARIVPLYALRGTKKYLLLILELFFPEIKVSIDDQALPSMTVGQSRVGRDTRLGGDIPFYFYVKLVFPNHWHTYENSQRDELLQRICSVIDSAKPAYTAYQLEYGFDGSSNNVNSLSLVG